MKNTEESDKNRLSYALKMWNGYVPKMTDSVRSKP
jgi:hypothetical protein